MTDVGSASDTASLLPPNATSLERTLEILTRRIDDIPVPIRDLSDVDACPSRFLPWLAFTRSVDVWDPAWPDAVKRAVIAASIALHRVKGSATSVRDVVRAFGGQLALREWWQLDPKGPPGTFDLVLTLNGADGEPAGAAFFDQVIAQVARTKPASAWFSATQGVSGRGGVAIGAAARPAVYRRLTFESQPPSEGILDFSNPANSSLIGLL